MLFCKAVQPGQEMISFQSEIINGLIGNIEVVDAIFNDSMFIDNEGIVILKEKAI
jgi:hypothetical protein